MYNADVHLTFKLTQSAAKTAIKQEFLTEPLPNHYIKFCYCFELFHSYLLHEPFPAAYNDRNENIWRYYGQVTPQQRKFERVLASWGFKTAQTAVIPARKRDSKRDSKASEKAQRQSSVKQELPEQEGPSYLNPIISQMASKLINTGPFPRALAASQAILCK